MKRNNSSVLLIVALALAGGAAWLANDWIFNLESAPQPQDEAEMASVVVAELKIPYGQVVNSNAVKLQAMPKDMVTEDYFTAIEQIDGLITSGDIYPGEILNRQRVTDKLLGAILASLIGSDMRALTVRVNDVIGVAGFLLPNNRVDILSARKQGDSTVITTVLQNMKVLAVDQIAAPKSQESNAVVVRAVTLEVTPDQAEVLYKAVQEGSIQLALRNPEDSYIAPPPPEPVVVKVESPKPEPKPVAKPVPKPKPKPIPKLRVDPPSYSVTVIRGTSSAKKKFNK